MNNEHVRDWLKLFLIPGVGSSTFIKLLSRFGTVSEILNASPQALEESVGSNVANRIVRYREVVNVDEELRLIEKHNVRIITLDDIEYPMSLAELNDPPLILYVKGTLSDGDLYSLAVVGTRNHTNYGRKVTEFFVKNLVNEQFTIVSGLAIGIDSIAHKTALDAGGRTIAFLGSGIDIVYPPENKELFEAIQQQGAIISTFPMGTKPIGNNFPIRNRFISGYTLGTLVIEASKTSGAMITAKHAVDQGKPVFAVPGPIAYYSTEGPHFLIRQGAKLVEKISDIIEEIPEYANKYLNFKASPLIPKPSIAIESTPKVESPPSPVKETITTTSNIETSPTSNTTPTIKEDKETTSVEHPLEAKILSAVGSEGKYIDEISNICNIPINEVASMLTFLEMRGLVKQLPGKRFVRS